MKKWIFAFVIIGLMISNKAFSHCQVPCGIYDDARIFKALTEHAHTIEKAIKAIKNKKTSQHQKVRWVMNKEDHATQIQEIMQNYFLAQRIKALPLRKLESKKPKISLNEAEKSYLQLVSLSQKIIFFAMKTKQAPSEVQLKNLKNALQRFEGVYLNSKA